MKILFEDTDKLQLHRNEVADLFHAIAYFSDAIQINVNMQKWKKNKSDNSSDQSTSRTTQSHDEL